MTLSKSLLLAASLVAISTAAIAEEGWYATIGGGWNHVHDDRFLSTGSNQGVEYDNGYAIDGAVGYQYSNGLRSEIELGYRNNDIDTIANSGASRGDVNVMSGMVNVLYDFDISDTALDTYVGVGGGIARLDYDGVTPVNGSSIDDSDVTPAMQAIAGVSYAVADNTELFVNYKYFHAANPDFTNAAGVKVDTDYDTSTVMAGLKFNLFAPTPVVAAVEPMPAPEPVRVAQAAPEPAPVPVSRTYIVFFDWDKAQVTDEAMAIIKQAAADAKSGNAVAIQVVGHADRSGSVPYNMKLSNTRAVNVENALAQLGINSAAIETQARGESDPLVPTADGVREPQNRRAEITYILNAAR